MPATTARQVAHAILWFCNTHGDLISNLKLQKLLYYTQAWHLALYDQALFDESFRAWVHGPVQTGVYREFKHFGFNPISVDVRRPSLTPKTWAHVEEVMRVYGAMSAFDLERHTHQEAPWQIARGAIPDDQPSQAIIDPKEMQTFYKNVLKTSAKEKAHR